MFNWYVSKLQVKEAKPKRSKQSKLPKLPVNYNGSKVIPGNHKVEFKKASEIKL